MGIRYMPYKPIAGFYLQKQYPLVEYRQPSKGVWKHYLPIDIK